VLAFGRAGRQCRPGCVTMARKRVRTLPVCARSVHLCVTDTVTPKVSENYRSRPPMLHVGCGSDLSHAFIHSIQKTALHVGCWSDYGRSSHYRKHVAPCCGGVRQNTRRILAVI